MKRTKLINDKVINNGNVISSSNVYVLVPLMETRNATQNNFFQCEKKNQCSPKQLILSAPALCKLVGNLQYS
jgi:hypothetical protein